MWYLRFFDPMTESYLAQLFPGVEITRKIENKYDSDRGAAKSDYNHIQQIHWSEIILERAFIHTSSW